MGFWTMCTAHGCWHLLNYSSFLFFIEEVDGQVFEMLFCTVFCWYTCSTFLPCTDEFSCWLPLCSDLTSGITASKIQEIKPLELSQHRCDVRAYVHNTDLFLAFPSVLSDERQKQRPFFLMNSRLISLGPA